MEEPDLYRHIARGAPVGVATRPAVFLDRDGVLIEETGYLHRVEEIRYIPGALQAVTRLNRAGWPVVLVTNQSGIGRGYYCWPDFEKVQAALEAQLAQVGGWFDGVWACGCQEVHAFRKPEPGMLLEAAEQLQLDLSRSWLVGDKTSDIETAVRAGLLGAILTETGYGLEMKEEVVRRALDEWTSIDIRYAPNLAAAVGMIL